LEMGINFAEYVLLVTANYWAIHSDTIFFAVVY